MVRSRIVLLVGVLGAIVGATASIRRFLPALLDASVTEVGVYLALAGLLSFVCNPLLAAAVGYRVGRRLDVATAYRRLFGLFLLAGSVGFVLGHLASLPLVPSSVSFVEGPAVWMLRVAFQGVATGVTFALAGLAGAAVAHFASGDPRERRVRA